MKTFATPAIEMYKGFEIRTTPNNEGHVSLVYNKAGKFIAGTVSDLTQNGKTSIEKAKAKIDKFD